LPAKLVGWWRIGPFEWVLNDGLSCTAFSVASCVRQTDCQTRPAWDHQAIASHTHPTAGKMC